VARKIVPLSQAELDDVPAQCSACRQWNPATRSIVERLLLDWGNCGFIAYDEGQPAGFTVFGPPSYFPNTELFPAGPISSDALFIACLFVDPEFRSTGLGKRLLNSVEKDTARRAATALEALAGRDEQRAPAVPVDFYLREGFFILRDDRRHPLMRLDLKSLASWSMKASRALDNLIIRQTEPAKTPI
jgi:GNAT superfamily N-acetyltransferase